MARSTSTRNAASSTLPENGGEDSTSEGVISCTPTRATTASLWIFHWLPDDRWRHLPTQLLISDRRPSLHGRLDSQFSPAQISLSSSDTPHLDIAQHNVDRLTLIFLTLYTCHERTRTIVLISQSCHFSLFHNRQLQSAGVVSLTARAETTVLLKSPSLEVEITREVMESKISV
jgi:hypothetical protein